jgi:hypothetical protein
MNAQRRIVFLMIAGWVNRITIKGEVVRAKGMAQPIVVEHLDDDLGDGGSGSKGDDVLEVIVGGLNQAGSMGLKDFARFAASTRISLGKANAVSPSFCF